VIIHSFFFFFGGNLIELKPLFLPTRLVTIAALLRRYSPSSHPLLKSDLEAVEEIEAPGVSILFNILVSLQSSSSIFSWRNGVNGCVEVDGTDH
jgi:hypothetical protein